MIFDFNDSDFIEFYAILIELYGSSMYKKGKDTLKFLPEQLTGEIMRDFVVMHRKLEKIKKIIKIYDLEELR